MIFCFKISISKKITAYDNFYFEAEKQTEYVKVWALVAQIKIVKIHQDQQGNNIHTYTVPTPGRASSAKLSHT